MRVEAFVRARVVFAPVSNAHGDTGVATTPELAAGPRVVVELAHFDGLLDEQRRHGRRGDRSYEHVRWALVRTQVGAFAQADALRPGEWSVGLLLSVVSPSFVLAGG